MNVVLYLLSAVSLVYLGSKLFRGTDCLAWWVPGTTGAPWSLAVTVIKMIIFPHGKQVGWVRLFIYLFFFLNDFGSKSLPVISEESLKVNVGERAHLKSEASCLYNSLSCSVSSSNTAWWLLKLLEFPLAMLEILLICKAYLLVQCVSKCISNCGGKKMDF